MSAIPVHDAESVISELPQPKGPGARLKAARQAKHLELDKVAAHLHLSQDMLVALEADDYDNLPARVFVVGYMRNYARHVGLPPEAILLALDHYLPARENTVLPKLGTEASEVFIPAARARRSSFSVASLFFLLAAIGIFFVWQKGYLGFTGQLADSGVTGIDISQPQSTLTGDQISLAGDEEKLIIPNKLDNEVKVLPELNDKPVLLESEPSAVEIPPQTTQREIVMPQPAAEIMVKPEIVLSFTEACWVDIRDASGKFKFVREAKAGTVQKLSGQAPYKVLIGNVNGTKLTINGEPFDLQRYNKANVARFSLDPSLL